METLDNNFIELRQLMVDIAHIRNRLTTMAASDIHGFEFNEGVSDEEINDAETEFGSKFAEDYRSFLSNFGCGYISSEDFMGLGGDIHLNIVNVSKEERRILATQFKNNLIPIRADGFGNYDCINLSTSTPQVSEIVLWRHESGELDLVISGYWEWFNQILDIIKDTEK